MTKPSEIFDTPEATSRVRGNENWEDDFRKQFDELKLKPPKNSMKNAERELIIWYFRNLLTTKDQEKEEAIAKARDQEAKLWFETWYSHYISPTKPLTGEFARFATERIQMTGYERDQALPTEDNN